MVVRQSLLLRHQLGAVVGSDLAATLTGCRNRNDIEFSIRQLLDIVEREDRHRSVPRAYVQTFADAVALGIICDYRVVVAVIDPAEVDSYAMHHGITLVKGDQQATRWVATQIAVSKAIQATGATRVITLKPNAP